MYVEVDPNPCLYPKFQEIVEFFGADKNKYVFIESPFEKALLPDMTYDLILTSPPFFSLEVYSNDENQSIHNRDLNAWFDDFLIESLNKAWSVLDRGGHMVIVINDIPSNKRLNLPSVNYTELMVNVFNGLHEDATFECVISYAQFENNEPRQPQPAWIWYKV